MERALKSHADIYDTHLPDMEKEREGHRGWKRSMTQWEQPDREESSGHTPEKTARKGKKQVKKKS